MYTRTRHVRLRSFEACTLAVALNCCVSRTNIINRQTRMDIRTSLFVHLVILLIAIYACQALLMSSSQSYTMKTDFSGNAICSVDTPMEEVTVGLPDLINQCGTRCSASKCCVFWQFRSDSTLCQMFGVTPQNFTSIPNCKGFSIISALNNRNQECPTEVKGVLPYGYPIYSQGCGTCLYSYDFYYALNYPVTWQQAVDICKSIQPTAHLLTIESQFKFNNILKQAAPSITRNMVLGDTRSQSYAWVGGQLANANASLPNSSYWQWKTTGGAPVNLTYVVWAFGRWPTNTPGSNCLALYSASLGMLRNYPCNSTRGFICELN